MGDTNLETANTLHDIVRYVLSAFDRPAYMLLGIVYQLFFNVASADLFSNDTILKFYGRVQIILGVFMMFHLAMTILRGIVNPGTFTDSKSGAGNFITRVATSLLLITIMIPIATPGRNEYEKQINNNGLLFGTLYSLQHRILANNTLGRLVLGTTDTEATYISGSSSDTELKKSSRIFTSSVLKGFYRINLVPESQRKSSGDKDPATINENRVCKSIKSSILTAYTRVDADPSEIISMVTESCDDGLLGIGGHYVFAYNPIISAIVGFVFVFILLSFTIDIAVRAVKLAVLRLIAPIPIISYMDPKGSKDSAFNSWVKLLTSTYLDLFIRLAVVYFVIFLIQDMIAHGFIMNHTSGIIGAFSSIIIWIGLFIFAKQSPKFIKQALGIKDDGGKLFSGFGELGGALATGAGMIGSFNASRTASKLSDQARGKDEKSLLNRGKHLLAGIAGGVSGGVTGFNAWQGAKDHQGKTVMDAINKRNATDVQRGASGSTMFGRWGSTGARLIQGEGATRFDAQTREIAQKKDIDKSAKDLFSYLEGKGKTDGASFVVDTAGIDINGHSKRFHGSIDQFKRARAQALADQQNGVGDGSFTFDGERIYASDNVCDKIIDEMSYAAGDIWATQNPTDNGFAQKRDTYNEAVQGATDPNHTGLYVRYVAGGPHTTSKLKKTSKSAGGEALSLESSAGYKRRQANYGATKK